MIALVCNKADLPSVMNTTTVKEYAQNERILYMETSAVTGEGVLQVFEAIGIQLVEKNAEELANAASENVRLKTGEKSDTRRCCG